MSDHASHGVVHEYDGIIEHDNKLPNWWLATLFAAIVFAIVYWITLHTAELWPSIQERYVSDVEAHAKQQRLLAAVRPIDDATLRALASDNDAVARGAQTFQSVCSACHGKKAEGLVGPNLTDNAWIHGSAPLVMFNVVGNGVLQKGMPAWFPTLGESGTKDVVAYMLTLRNTNVPGKAPEGTAE